MRDHRFPSKELNREHIIGYLRGEGCLFRSSGKEIVIKICPFCHGNTCDPTNQFKLHINSENGLYYCQRCESKGNWGKFIHDTKGNNAGHSALSNCRKRYGNRSPAWEVWSEAISLSHPDAAIGRQYLEKRGIKLQKIPDSIRFYRSLSYLENKQKSYFPALVAKVTGLHGVMIGIQRIYLDPLGVKASVLQPKKMLGTITGGAVCFEEPSECLHVGEGVETTLAILSAIDECCWSAVSANGLRKLDVPPHVKTVHVWIDIDQGGKGQDSATELEARLKKEGKNVFLHRPPGVIPDGAKSLDWLDILNQQGIEAIQTELRNSSNIKIEIPSSNKPRAIETDWPTPISDDALIGIAGDFVRTIEPDTESDPAALLLQFLVLAGNVIGRSAYYLVGTSDKHSTNLFSVLVGASSKARKGTSWSQVRGVGEFSDPTWSRNCIKHGLSSGEGLIYNVRDPVPRTDGRDSDPGVSDKRLLVQEGEFAQVLKNIKREGNTLSPTIRNAWDCGNLSTLVKNDPNKATGSHISILGHITCNELLRYLTDTETANGFGNRFLWVCARRSKLLPEGGDLSEAKLNALNERIRGAIESAKRISGRITWEPTEARHLWHEMYPILCSEKSGIFGQMVGRAEAQVVRMTLIYALLDDSQEMKKAHLLAALAVWKYCEDSCRYIFGHKLGDPDADKILAALMDVPTGLSRTEISALFKGHRKQEEISRAYGHLLEKKLAKWVETFQGNRRLERLMLC